MRATIEQVGRSIRSLVTKNKINSLIYSLIVPLLVGVYATFYTDLVKISPLLFWIPVAFFILLALITAHFTYDVKLAPEVYIEMDRADQQITELQNNTIFFSMLQEQALVYSAIVREHVKTHKDGDDHLGETIDEICSLLVENREDLFDFQLGELWSFAAYVYCSKDGKLHSIWRQKHSRHPSQGIGRTWEIGQGHVGIAFAQKEPKICPDMSAPGVAEMFSPKEAKQDYDRTAYASFVSEPIGPLGDAQRPYGVLVATRACLQRLDPE